MKKNFMVVVMAIVVLGNIVYGENLISLSLGASWPKVIFSDTAAPKKTAGTGSLAIGKMIDNKFGIGIGTTFLWNRSQTTQDSAGFSTVLKDRQYYMFPVYGFLLLDPLSALVIHPSLEAQVGYNSLIYSYWEDSTATSIPRLKNGYYYGLYIKLLAMANYSLGEKVTISGGVSYQFSDTKRNVDSNLFVRRDMGAFGISGGFRFVL